MKQKQYWENELKRDLDGRNHFDYYKQIVFKELKPYIKENIKVLEAGSGSGIITRNYANMVPSSGFVGLDYIEESVDYGNKEADSLKLNNCIFLKGDIFDMPFPEEEFYTVFNSGVLEHYEEEEQIKILKEMARVSSKYVIVNVPRGRGVVKGEIVEYKFSKKKLKDLFEKSGINLIKTIPIGAMASLVWRNDKFNVLKFLEKFSFVYSYGIMGIGEKISCLGTKSANLSCSFQEGMPNKEVR